MSQQINLRVSEDLLARIDERRGLIPRNPFLTSLIEHALHAPIEDLARHPLARAGLVPGPNVEDILSSTQAKAGVKPIAKRAKK